MFEALFQPKGIAVVGSAAQGKLGNVIVTRLVGGGFANVYPVNPKGQGVGDRPGYTSVQDIPDQVDLAMIACPVKTVPAVMEDCGKGGVKAAVVITSGFRETGNIQAEEEVLAVAQRYGVRFVGPNCAGMLNTHANLYATLEEAPPKGNVALLSQSGSVGGIFMSWANEHGLGISKFVSYGNSLDWNVTEYLEYLKDDPETGVIALYLEQIKEGRRFMQVMKQVTKVKPVVIIKSGKTAAGSRATMSHTGSMAGEDHVNDAALRECGAMRVDSVSEMFNLCKALATMPLIQGGKILLVTNSGGPAIMACDRAEEIGLAIQEPGETLKEQFRGFLPAHASLKNPVDITVEGTPEWYRDVIIHGMGEYDAAIAIYVGTPYLEAMPYAKAMAEAAVATGKPVLTNFYVGTDIDESKEYLRLHGIPNFTTGEQSAWVVKKMLEYAHYLKKEDTSPHTPAAIGNAGQGQKSMLPEHQTIGLLADNKIPVPRHVFVEKIEDVAAACRQIGYPVVMKVVSPQIVHKSDAGGVKLNVQNQEQAEGVFFELQQVARGKGFLGVMVYPMLDQGAEVIIGIKRDPAFGPVVLFGLGGIYSEVFKDVVLQIAPVTEHSAKRMIESISAYPILAGIRGKKGKDVNALAKTIANVSKLPFLYPDIQEIDLNPVFVYEDGVQAADMRIIL